MTRQDLLDGKVSHEEYYSALAKALHITYSVESARRAFARPNWDSAAHTYVDKAHAFRVFREFGDVWSTAGHVCALQQAAKEALERST
jgi:hypothetical protein